MATNPGSYGSSSTTTAPTSTTDTFPTSPKGEGLGVNGISVANISVADFLANYDISSTEQSTYLSQGANGQPALNQNALFLMQYKAMDAVQREEYQQDLVNAGLLPQTDANGILNSASLSAFKSAIANSAATGVQVDQYLNQYQGTNNVETTLAQATATTEKEAQAPTTATLENPTTLAAAITNAFDQTVGYAPNQDQINAFISQIQGQDVSNAEAPHQAAEAQLAQLKGDQSALTQLGPNGIDAVIQAYTSAIHGVTAAAGNPGNPQGPVTGQSPVTIPGQAAAPGLTLGGPGGSPALPATQTTTTGASRVGPMTPQLSGNIVNTVQNGSAGFTPGAAQPYSYTSHTGTAPGINVPATAATAAVHAGPQYGGFYALTPADWAEAKKLLPAAQKYATAGSAPLNVQQAAFTQLLQTAYDNNGGSWASAIQSIAGGGPAASKNLKTFATSIANQVNDQLTQLTNTINTQDVTTKTTAPDAAAEGAAAAKAQDPVGYMAANYASFGSLLNEMLAGAPSMYDQGTADSFTGPVTPSGVSAGAATAPTTQAA